MKTVRFLQNSILTVVHTGLNELGEMVVTETPAHVAYGELYILSRWEVNGKLATLYFPDDESSKIHGVAQNVELDICQFVDSDVVAAAAAQTASAPGGCGCGH